jgi:hypothetical protein
MSRLAKGFFEVPNLPQMLVNAQQCTKCGGVCCGCRDCVKFKGGVLCGNCAGIPGVTDSPPNGYGKSGPQPVLRTGDGEVGEE